MDRRIVHERWGSISNPSLDDHLHYPDDMRTEESVRTPDETVQDHRETDHSLATSGVH